MEVDEKEDYDKTYHILIVEDSTVEYRRIGVGKVKTR